MLRRPVGGGTRNAGTGAQCLHSRDDRPAVQRCGRNLHREPGRGAGRFRRGLGRAQERTRFRGRPFAAAGLYRHDVGPLVAHHVGGHEGPVQTSRRQPDDLLRSGLCSSAARDPALRNRDRMASCGPPASDRTPLFLRQRRRRSDRSKCLVRCLRACRDAGRDRRFRHRFHAGPQPSPADRRRCPPAR